MKILIIGLGSIARKHLYAIQQLLPNAQVSALRYKKTNDSYPNINNIYDISELSEKPDFIIISNPTNKHYETIEKCIAVGCPLMIEKPVLENTNGYEKLLDMINKNNIITYIACNLRFHPAIQYLRSELEVNLRRINEVNIYCGSYLPKWRPERDFRLIYSANAEMGGGVHLDLIHEIDICLWLFGTPTNTQSVKKSNSSLNISAIDYAHYYLVYDKFCATITLNYFRQEPKRQIEVVFDDGTLIVDLLKCSVMDGQGNGVFQSNADILPTYVNQLAYFIDSISTNTKMMNDFEEAIKTLKISNY